MQPCDMVEVAAGAVGMAWPRQAGGPPSPLNSPSFCVQSTVSCVYVNSWLDAFFRWNILLEDDVCRLQEREALICPGTFFALFFTKEKNKKAHI